VSTSNVLPEYQDIVSNFTASFTRMDPNGVDSRKFVAVEKALVALFTKLNAHELSVEMCALLLRFSQVCDAGGPEAKELNRKLTDQFWDQYKAFKELKFVMR
jgi:hypothetical protein